VVVLNQAPTGTERFIDVSENVAGFADVVAMPALMLSNKPPAVLVITVKATDHIASGFGVCAVCCFVLWCF
jgi:hypothetical protein